MSILSGSAFQEKLAKLKTELAEELGCINGDSDIDTDVPLEQVCELETDGPDLLQYISDEYGPEWDIYEDFDLDVSIHDIAVKLLHYLH